MVNYGFILVPLYIYPLPGLWDPLFEAAENYPNVTFRAIINPDTGPGGACPTSDYINATAYLNQYPNIQTLAYVHTAARYDCGPYSSYICPCTQPLSAVETNITHYQNWNTPGKCTNKDIHLNGIFFDESPSDGNCTSYMQNLTTFAQTTLTHGTTVLFNSGQAVDPAYWDIADYINVFEDTEAVYDSADIGALDGEGVYHAQTTMIIYAHSDDSGTLQRDVDTILNVQRDAMAGVYITDLSVYDRFPTDWMEFVGDVQGVVDGNRAAAS